MQQLYHSAAQKRRHWLKFRIRIYGLLFLLFLILIGAVYLLRESNLVKITKVEIVGLEPPQSEELRKKLELKLFRKPLAGILGTDNFLIWPRRLSYQDLTLANLTIDKNWLTREVKITAQKREKLGIWCEGEECWWFDSYDGLLIEGAPASEGQLIFKINQTQSATTSETGLRTGEKIMPPNHFANLKKIMEILKKLELSVKDAVFHQDLEELRIKTEEGAALIFSLRFDPLNILGGLRELLGKTPIGSINYLDLTVENKIYLKLK